MDRPDYISAYEWDQLTIKAGELYEPDCALVDAIGVVPDGGFCDAAEALQRDLFFKLQRGA